MLSFTAKITSQIPCLEGDDVHVWKVDLSGSQNSQDVAALTEGERAKINRLKHSKHRLRAVAMRVQLRHLLGVYLCVNPAEIVFQKAEFGKPFVPNVPISFSVSHSGSIALVAISLNNVVGIDVERWRELDNLSALVRRNFSSAEKTQWEEIADDQREAVFFNIWSCKEAFIKATGRGLGMGVSSCSFDLNRPHKMTECPSEYGEVFEWSSVPLNVAESASASLLVRAKTSQPLLCHFDSETPPQMV